MPFSLQNSHATTSIASSGLSAPESTEALVIDQSNGASGWHSGPTYGYTNDFGFSIYLRPDNTIADTQAILVGTDGNSGTAMTIGYDAGNFFLIDGNDFGGNSITGGSFTDGAWSKVAVIVYGGTTHFYVDGVEAGTTSTAIGTDFNSLRLGFFTDANQGGSAGFDEWDVFTFDSASDSLASVESVVSAVPEPSSAALLGLGGMALLLRRRKGYGGQVLRRRK